MYNIFVENEGDIRKPNEIEVTNARKTQTVTLRPNDRFALRTLRRILSAFKTEPLIISNANKGFGAYVVKKEPKPIDSKTKEYPALPEKKDEE